MEAMPQVMRVTLEKELPDGWAAYLKTKSGRALAREADRIDGAARRRSVTALTALLSENPAVLAEQMRAEGFDPAKMRLPAEQWFAAMDGLKTVRALIEHITANLNDFKLPNPILKDLKAIEALLAHAETAGVRFHMTKSIVT